VLTYTIRITNHLRSSISGAVVTDTWAASEDGQAELASEFNGNYRANPPGFISSFTYTLPTDEDESGQAVWQLNPLDVGFRGTIEITMTVPPILQPLDVSRDSDDIGPSVLGNSVGIHAPGVNVNDPDQVVTAVEGPVLVLKKSAVPEPGVGPRPGRLVTYSLRLENVAKEIRPDSVPATGIVIGENLPADLKYEGAAADLPATDIEYRAASRRVTWTLPSGFRLNPGQVTTVTVTTRLSVIQDWRQKIENDKESCWAISRELVDPVICWSTVRINPDPTSDGKTLGIFDKTYVTEPSNLDPRESFPNRYITYTVQIFNPLSQTIVNNLRITDVMPPTWDFVEMVDGDPPVWPTGEITRTAVWFWPGLALEANGVLSFSFKALIGPDTPVQGTFCRGVNYYNALAASADEFPIIYQYGAPLASGDGLAQVKVEEPIQLSKSAYPTRQVAGELVTYTVSLENVGDRPVNNIIFTDTLPEFFVFDSMVTPLPPISVVSNTVAWDVGTINAGAAFELVFRAIADGIWQQKYSNGIDGYSPETTFCARSTARVEVLSPLVFDKTATPALDSGDWVVQGESFAYDVEFTNRSLSFDYVIDLFEDTLYDGFVANGSQVYTSTSDLPKTLQAKQANSWIHSFQVETPGEGSGTEWCNALQIAEDRSNKNENRELYQETGTFGVRLYESDPELWAYNGEKVAPILFKPHVDLRQVVYPNRVGLAGTVQVTLTLVNNMRNQNGGTERAVDNIALTYTIPPGFTFIEMISPSPAPFSQTEELLFWDDLDLPAGANEMVQLRLRLQAPFELTEEVGYAVAVPTADPSICIPNSKANYEVVKGVEVSKRPVPETTGPFGIVQYRMKLTNLTRAPIRGLLITDTLPPGFQFVSVLDGYPQPASVRPLVWRDLALDPLGAKNDDLEIRFKARASGLFGLYYNRVEGFSASSYVTLTRDYFDKVEVAVLPGVALYKTANTDRADAGQTVIYTLTVDNRSAEDITGVRITDTLPPGFNYLGMIWGELPITTTPDLVWLVGEVDSGAKTELIFGVSIDSQIPSDIYCNQASGTAVEKDDPTAEVVIPDTDLTACMTVKGLPTVTRNKMVSPLQVGAGNLVTYTIVLFNETDATQTLRLTDTLPLGIMFDSVVGPTPQPNQTSPLVWSGLQVGAQQTRTLVFRALVDLYARSGTYYNRIDAVMSGLKLPPKPNLAPLEVEEIPRYDLQIVKSDGVVSVDEGQLLLYTITYTNVNDADLSLNNVIITDTFAPHPPYANPLGIDADWSQAATDVYTHFVGDLGPGESGSVEFRLQLAGTIPTNVWIVSNTVQIDHSTTELAFETNADNNRFSDIDVLRGPDLTAGNLTISPPEPVAGEPIIFSVLVRNQGKSETVNEVGQGWFVVELYLKGTGFTPAGPPIGVFDHIGGFWPDAIPSQERLSYLCYLAGLAAGNEETCDFLITDVDQIDDYDVYVQVDVSQDLLQEPWGHDYGVVREAFEENNIKSYGLISIGGPEIYLPILFRNK
jgi:uncharacterized repeat protein (TIGR01451 family)